MHLQKLMNIIVTEGKCEPYPCIKDIVENGLSLDRFAEGDRRPNRNETAIFLAAWCKSMGFAPEVYSDWLIDFAVDVLSGISSSAPSQIRHSTKSTIKYIHRSDVPFSCNCKNNIFKAVCSLDCSVYEEMEEIYLQSLEVEQKRIERLQQIKEESTTYQDTEPPPSTELYEKQFDEAVTLITQYIKKGYIKTEITVFLNEKGFKTATGHDWKLGDVSRIAAMKGLTIAKRKRWGHSKL